MTDLPLGLRIKQMGIRILLAALLAHALLFSVILHRKLHAQEGFAAGAPSPNKGDVLPGDVGSAEAKALECPAGQKQYPVLECINKKLKKKRILSEDCASYTPVLKCNKRPFKLHCTKKGEVTRERMGCVKIK